MTVGAADLGLYAFALLLLFLTPGPVLFAMVARTLSGGFSAAWPLALGVVVGDVFWPFLAIFSLTWVVGIFAGLMIVLKVLATIMFIWMGVALLRQRETSLMTNSRLTQPGKWAGFAAGVAVILGNPKAMLFYMGILPGFFDLTALTTLDMLAIVFLSLLIPLLGNMVLALGVARVKNHIPDGAALRRLNTFSGVLLIGVGVVIPFS